MPSLYGAGDHHGQPPVDVPLHGSMINASKINVLAGLCRSTELPSDMQTLQGVEHVTIGELSDETGDQEMEEMVVIVLRVARSCLTLQRYLEKEAFCRSRLKME